MARTGGLEVLSVGALNRQAKQLLESNFALAWVEGEISNFKHHSSGHMYFSLKDATAAIPVVMFASANSALPFRPGDGMKVVARGRVTLYEARGQYQMIAQNMYPGGEGALWLKFEELRDRLKAEGLFDAHLKRTVPRVPKTVGVVTSPTSAAVQDVLNVIERRAPHVTALVRPTLVQGDAAAADIAEAIAELAAQPDVDVIIVARGGGSLEDLWAFNEEIVVRAVAACEVPVISAVGHETDTTLIDLVADLRAPTPSAAAELAVPEREAYLQYIDEQKLAMATQLQRKLRDLRIYLAFLENQYALRQPLKPIELWQQTVRDKDHQLVVNFNRHVANKGMMLGGLTDRLNAVDPRQILKRGYVLVSDPATGKPIIRKDGLAQGDGLRLNFSDGAATATVDKLEDDH